MRENLLVLVAFLGLMMPFIARADEQETEARVEKRVIIVEGGDESQLSDIREMVEKEIGDAKDIELYVTQDETGEIRMEKRAWDHGGRAVKCMRHMGRDGPGMHAVHPGKPMKIETMSEDAAYCILKNIKNATTDLAVTAVVKACKTISSLE